LMIINKSNKNINKIKIIINNNLKKNNKIIN